MSGENTGLVARGVHGGGAGRLRPVQGGAAVTLSVASDEGKHTGTTAWK